MMMISFSSALVSFCAVSSAAVAAALPSEGAAVAAAEPAAAPSAQAEPADLPDQAGQPELRRAEDADVIATFLEQMPAMADLAAEMAALLRSVVDQESADAAAPKLDTLVAQLDARSKVMEGAIGKVTQGKLHTTPEESEAMEEAQLKFSDAINRSGFDLDRIKEEGYFGSEALKVSVIRHFGE